MKVRRFEGCEGLKVGRFEGLKVQTYVTHAEEGRRIFGGKAEPFWARLAWADGAISEGPQNGPLGLNKDLECLIKALKGLGKAVKSLNTTLEGLSKALMMRWFIVRINCSGRW